MEGVILKPIPGAPGANYMAGNDGRIYSRTKYRGFGRKDYVDWYPLKGCPNGSGYYIVSLCHEGKRVTKSVHKLVCLAFHGMPPEKGLQVRHLDGNQLNNTPMNLCWGTYFENWMDRKAVGNGCAGERHPMSKITDEERRHIAWVVGKGIASGRHVARVLGLSQMVVLSAIKFSNQSKHL